MQLSKKKKKKKRIKVRTGFLCWTTEWPGIPFGKNNLAVWRVVSLWTCRVCSASGLFRERDTLQAITMSLEIK